MKVVYFLTFYTAAEPEVKMTPHNTFVYNVGAGLLKT